MLATIQELEQEIEQFHKNIKDSNELMNQLQTVVEYIQAVPGQIKDNSDQQHSAFLTELEKG